VKAAQPVQPNLLDTPAKKIPQDHGTPRPDGIPTVPEMVTELLLEAESKGLRGLSSRDILLGIDAKF
jgi:hypothetical protein